MANIKTYEKFPLWIPIIAILVSVIGYIIGAFILYGCGILFSILYLFYCFCAELLVIRKNLYTFGIKNYSL